MCVCVCNWCCDCSHDDDRYMGFLADSGLLDRLTAVTVRGRGLDTRLLLCEHAEKIQAAMAVRKTHNQ